MNQCIGSCSICGGRVMGHVGAWWSVNPPPPAQCESCGAVEARTPVIPMVPRHPVARKHLPVNPFPGIDPSPRKNYRYTITEHDLLNKAISYLTNGKASANIGQD